MDYKKQEAYLRSSRIRCAVSVLIFLMISFASLTAATNAGPRTLIPLGLISLALAGSIYYTPDYLHLTVVPHKGARWQVKIRWRIIAAVFLLGLLLITSTDGKLLVVAAVVWLAAANLASKKFVPPRLYPAYFWVTDLLLLTALTVPGWLNLLAGSLLLAAAAHLAVVTSSGTYGFTTRVGAWGILALIFAARFQRLDMRFALVCAVLLLLVVVLTFWLVSRAEKQNGQNIAEAMQELNEFTGYDTARIRELWETSNQQLARNWEQAAIHHDDRERMAQWYRDNSELYLFAISAYNLEYKRIKSNLKVIRFARGSCLDYGAGNGEILLELARRGHTVTYFDVEGVTMRFARHRAERQKLAIAFARTKDELKAIAKQRGFDTIYSFDVLEHLPDLPGELSFLSSLLAPGGKFVFDVPAGSTKAHPMHLNHDLNVLAYMGAKGLKDRRGLSLRMPFRKEEKYVFEA
jgi:2-polyprenyl-3-methyl-5-hydroxy-6-metoxy-1,4-benzoquinol methylase